MHREKCARVKKKILWIKVRKIAIIMWMDIKISTALISFESHSL